ncbi:MAG TPA: amidohydrolase family protein [Sphingomicrobium sp.]
MQWEASPVRDPRFLPSLTLPCEGGKAPNIGFRCFADGSEFPPIDEVRRLAVAGKIRALGEINAQYMGVAPDDPRLEPYFALAEELDLPVGLHLGIGPPGSAYTGRPGFPPRKSPNYSAGAGDVLALEKVLLRHPNLRLYVMHAAWPFGDAMIYMLYMHPQLMVDLSVLQWAIPRPAYYSYLKDLVDAGFADRLMFGSDGSPKRLREGVTAILDAPFLTEAQKRAILHDNAARFLKLAKP